MKITRPTKETIHNELSSNKGRHIYNWNIKDKKSVKMKLNHSYENCIQCTTLDSIIDSKVKNTNRQFSSFCVLGQGDGYIL